MKRVNILCIFSWFVFVLHSSLVHAQSRQPHLSTLDHECTKAYEQLADQNELTNQVSEAYMQSIDNLEQVYLSFGERLSRAKDSNEMTEIANFFNEPRKTLEKVRIQNRKAIDEMNAEVRKLTEVLRDCYEKSAVLAGIRPIKTDENLIIFGVNVGSDLKFTEEISAYITGMSHFCTKLALPKVRSISKFVHEVSLNGSIYNCYYSLRVSQKSFGTSVNLGKLSPGRHTLRFSTGFDYIEKVIEVKP